MECEALVPRLCCVGVLEPRDTDLASRWTCVCFVVGLLCVQEHVKEHTITNRDFTTNRAPLPLRP